MKRLLIFFAFHITAWLSLSGRLLKAQQARPSDFLILTAWTPDIEKYALLSAENKSTYSRKHGYHFRAIREGFDASRPPPWSKIRFIQEALRQHRWVFWSDADSLIMNPEIRLENLLQPGSDILLTEASTPYRHINTGQMLFRSCIFSRLFLEAVWRQKAFIHDGTWEQRAVNHLMETCPLPRVHIVPNRICNAFAGVPEDPDPYQPGDFIVHFPGCSDKYELMKRYAALAQT